jgi:general secretion pathway protein H
MSATGSRGESGATLLEMLVVLGVLGLITGLVFPSVIHPLQRMTQLQARAALAANLRLARAEAARRGRAVVVDLAGDGGGYGWDSGAVRLPAALRIDGQTRSIRFFADGSSSGGRFWIRDVARAEAVEVDPLGVVTTASGG